MTAYLLPGMLGLLTGLLLRWAGFADSAGLRRALGLRRCLTLRSGLSALGYAVAGSALLLWLAVLDVDALLALPLGWRVLVGGGLFGVCAGLCGFTPSTAFAGLGADNAPEALCTLAGLTLATLFLPEGEAVPAVPADLPTQLFAGLLLSAIALCIPNPKPIVLAPEPGPPVPEEIPESESLTEDEPEPDSDPTPEDTTFVALLEGEEPLVIDTEEDNS